MSPSPAGSSSGPALSPEELVEEAGKRARRVAPVIAGLPTGIKNEALADLADSLLNEADRILEANELDVQAAERRRMPESAIDRLILTYPRLGALAQGVREVAAAPDPVGEVLRGSRRPNGLMLQEVRVPLGVVGLITEGRPNTSVDAISLCLKAGNAVVLLGSEDDSRSNRVILEVVERSLSRQGVPADAVQLVRSTDPRALERMIHLREYLDLLIPRGSAELINRVCNNATVPTLETGPGNCHVFVERTAQVAMAADIAFNAKVQRPGMANSMETLLIDADIAPGFLSLLGPRMQAAGVELRGCERTRKLLGGVRPATEEDWSTAYQDLILAVKIVDGLEAALAHIAAYGTQHSEAIVTQDYFAGKRFCQQVDAAAVYVNASTRFTDGFEFGLGAELGISTQKLHRRGPIGLRGLTTWKWIVYGEGQVRG